MDVKITITDAVKKYGDFTAIPGLSLEIQPGEFFTLLGPSGCGKTTLLRMIAGFNSIEGGSFYFGDRLINDLDPAKRNIGMVFQNYAIFPHLTVRKNVAFGLKNKKLPKDVIKAKTEEFMALMKISEYADRLPEKLSGGQQQRVALARALAIEPEVLLMDEPLSNLDAKLRVEMRSVIKEIQNRLGITTVYVTHDQEEAMAVSDRIAVMNLGVIQQIGTPKTLYQRPANQFVATFIGRTNLMDATVKVSGKEKSIVFKNGYTVKMANLTDVKDGQKVVVSVRPEELVINTRAEGGSLVGKVLYSTFLGLNTHYVIEFPD
ncbi:MAG: ABC transporter ATP-binding protein, partial [Spirochaetales bacterium]|nr:ABC transporter ATP-binding protein [Spirochaetales bacterium]